MTKLKKQKYATYLRIAIILYTLVLAITLISIIATLARPAPSSPATNEKMFQQQRSDIDRWPVMSLNDFKKYAENKEGYIRDIRIESDNRVSVVVGTGDYQKVLVIRNVSEDQARQELRQYGTITDNTAGTISVPGWSFISSLLPVIVLAGPFIIVWLWYKTGKA